MKTFKLSSKERKKFKSPSQLDRERQNFTPAYRMACKLRSSIQWQKCRELVLNKYDGICMYCQNAIANEVHHIKPASKYPDLVFDLDNLVPLCSKCHTWIEARGRRGENTEKQIKERMAEYVRKR